MPIPLLRPARRAFTLVELLISLGIALLLIYGINLVFRAVTDTVRTGNALAVATRKMRSVDATVTLDFEGTPNELNPFGKLANGGVPQADTDRRWSGIAPVATDINDATSGVPFDSLPKQPAITIFCKRTFAFMSKADQDLGPNAAQPWVEDEDETGTTFTNFKTDPNQLPRVGKRVHRTDTIGIFTGGSYIPRAVRPKSEEGTGVALQAWVWYGHLLQHNTNTDLVVAKAADLDKLYPVGTPGKPSASFVQPGDDATPNPRNFYASDWVLGRMAVTLLPRKQSTNQFPGTPMLGLPNAEPVQQVFAEGASSPTAIDFSAEERFVSYNVANPAAGSNFTPDAGDNSAVPIDRKAASPVPFTSGLNDVAAVWTGLLSFGGEALLPTGDVGLRTPNDATGTYSPGNFHGLVRRYQTEQTNAEWWKRSMVELGTAATSPPYRPLRFNTVSAFSRPLDVATPGVNLLTPQAKSAMQATYLAKGCTQFIVEFAGDFCAQNATTAAKTGNAPDGILDFRIVPIVGPGTATRRETRWYGLPRDVDGDGLADVDRVSALLGGPQPFEKTVSGDPDFDESYAVAFGPNELYPSGGTVQQSVRPWLIRLTVNMNDASSNLGSGLQRDFVFKIR